MMVSVDVNIRTTRNSILFFIELKAL
jgi:hypothetical protein